MEPNAAVAGASEIEIAAPPERVWKVLAAIDRWPSWNPDVKSMSITGEVRPGSVFRWKAGPSTITSTIRLFEPPRLISWTGKTFGMRANHLYCLEAGDGRTIVRTEESFYGVFARLLRRTLQKTLDDALESSLRHLKAEVERPDAGS
jgi:uncharacterized protein YndB with AHSA1/START domain